MIILLIFCISYLVGSFPTAYIFLKKFKNIDITQAGSGNVGALNSYQVSSSKIIGLLVLLIDLIKGIAVGMISKYFFPEIFWLNATSIGLAVLGHCYSPWLKFKGGKGLATAAGGSFTIAPIIFVIWVLFWLTSFIYKRKLQFSNISATLLTLLITVTSADIISKESWFTSPGVDHGYEFIIPISALLLIIISKHLDALKEIFFSKSKGRESNEP